MAKKITELTELTSYATNDLLIIEDVSANTTKKITWENLIADNSITAAKLDGIDKSLLTVDSNPYKFSVYRNAAQNVSSTATKVNYDTEVFDTNNNFDSSTNFRYTAPVDGFYHFDARIDFSSTLGVLFLYKNGVEHKRGNDLRYTGVTGCILSVLVQATAGDYFEVFALAGGTVAMGVGASLNYFTGFFVSRT